ncbi:hypothetical protein EON62_01590, partial [archaeon]
MAFFSPSHADVSLAYNLGYLRIAAVVPQSGAYAQDWTGVGDALMLWAAQVNQQNANRGAMFVDLAGTTLFLKVNVSIIDGGSEAATHRAAVMRVLSNTQPWTQSVPPYNPLIVDPPTRYTLHHALIGVHPAFSRQEAVDVTSAGVLNVHCCTGSRRLVNGGVSYGHQPQLLFNSQPPVSSYAVTAIKALARRGVRDVAVLIANNDFRSLEACAGVRDAAQEASITLSMYTSYTGRPSPGEAVDMGGPDSRLLPLDAVSGDVPSASSLELLFITVVDQMFASDITSVIHCGFAEDAALLLRELLERRNFPLESFFSFPGLAAPYRQNMTSARASDRAHSAHGLAIQAFTRAANIRYGTSGVAWLAQQPAEDAAFGSNAAFVSSYRAALQREPTWRDAWAVASATSALDALTNALQGCVSNYPLLHVMLYDSAAITCAGNATTTGYREWVRALETTISSSVVGTHAFAASHDVVTAPRPVTQFQSVDDSTPTVAQPSLDAYFVLPMEQAQAVGVNFPARRALVFPMPGSSYTTPSSSTGTVIIAIFACATLLILLALILLWQHRYKASVRKGKLLYVACGLLGELLAFAWPLTLIGRASAMTCAMRVIAPVVAVTFIVVPFLAKAWHVRMQYKSLVHHKVRVSVVALPKVNARAIALLCTTVHVHALRAGMEVEGAAPTTLAGARAATRWPSAFVVAHCRWLASVSMCVRLHLLFIRRAGGAVGSHHPIESFALARGCVGKSAGAVHDAAVQRAGAQRSRGVP